MQESMECRNAGMQECRKAEYKIQPGLVILAARRIPGWLPFRKTTMRYLKTLILGCVFLGCQTQRSGNQEQTVITQQQEQTLIINFSVDSALKSDSVMNTGDFWIDFSEVPYFKRPAIIDFLKLKKNFIEINADSLLKNDLTWTREGYLKKMVLDFKKIEIKGDSIIINLDKIKATDGSNGVEIIILKNQTDYKVISSKMTWIS